jgi:predicted aconitase with swiveling domain
MSYKVITAKFYARGKAEARALVTDKSLCFVGGLDPKTGKIIETGHPLKGQDITGKILVFPRGHGSSGSSGILLEAIRCNHAPAAIINIFCEPIIATGSIVAKVFYGKSVPIATVLEDDFKRFSSDILLKIDDKEKSITILE